MILQEKVWMPFSLQLASSFQIAGFHFAIYNFSFFAQLILGYLLHCWVDSDVLNFEKKID